MYNIEKDTNIWKFIKALYAKIEDLEEELQTTTEKLERYQNLTERCREFLEDVTKRRNKKSK